MTTNHTLGPWLLGKLATPDYAPEYAVYVGDGPSIARVVNGNCADAALIAAAPDLLLALLMLTDTIAFQFAGEVERNLTRDAIAKALGEGQ